MCKFFQSCCLLLAAWSGLSTLTAEEPKIKVLIVEGVTNHDWPRRVEIVRAILAKDGSFDMDYSITPSTAGDPAWNTWRPDFTKYDVVLSGYNNYGGLPDWPQPVKTALESFVQGGGGFFAYHEANNSFENWPAYNQIIGTGWRTKNFGKAITVNANGSLNIIPAGSGEDTNHGARQDVVVTKRGSHPIHDGLPASWKVADIEIYRYARGPAENLTVLSYAQDLDGLRFPIDWTVEYGLGRCYASSYGHFWNDSMEPPSVRCAAYQTLMVRALKWLAHRDPGITPPADFPTASTISLRPYAERVSGLDQVPGVGAFANGALPQVPTLPQSVAVVRAFSNISWDSPTQAVPFPGSTDLLIAEMRGIIYRVADNDMTTTRSQVLNISDRSWYYNWTINDNGTKHGGLQTIALHPRFGKGEGKDFIFVFYIHHPTSNANPNATEPYYTRLSRFSWNTTTSTFDPGTEQIMINQYDTSKGHDGGGLAFGADGFLYISCGDEGTQGTEANAHTQKINDRFRSGLWRIDVDQQGGNVSHPIIRQPYNASPSHGSLTSGYYIPNDNPWVNPNGSVLEEYYSIGLRNPHRIAFDALTGIWIGDVGYENREEVDLVDGPGLNFQWSYREGTAAGFRTKPSPLIGTERDPVFDYSHSGSDSLGNCVIGGYVYRGNALPWLQGKYIFGDNGAQGIHALEYDPATGGTSSVEQIGQARAGNIWTGIASFGHTAANELLVMQMGGGQTGNGRIYRILPTSTPQESTFPATLAATGLFTPPPALTPATSMIPYEVNMPLWSDGTDKKRWMMIPGDGNPSNAGERITYSENDRWNLPVGSVLVKNFALPDGGRNLETRVLVRGTSGEWGGVTYKWLPDGSGATLLESGAMETLQIGGDSVDYLYPARSQCSTCHSSLAGGVLGLSTRQFNRTNTYPATGRTANQIETLSKLGFIQTTLSEVTLRNALTSADRMDPTVSDVDFVRSYIDSNCSHCHAPGGTRAAFDARLTTLLPSQNLLCGLVTDNLGISGAAVIKPGLPASSIMLERMNTIAGHRMPPLGRGRVDQEAVVRLADWLLGMEVDSCTGSQGGVPTGDTVMIGNGNTPTAAAAPDTWHSNMIINKTDVFTNNTGGPLVMTPGRFLFRASAPTGTPLTPFIVRVNSGTNNFTVIAVGSTLLSHSSGVNDVAFSSNPTPLTIAAGQTIAAGFLDAYPNGSGPSGQGVVDFNAIAPTDQIHYSGGISSTNSGSVTTGLAPVFGSSIVTSHGRNYYFGITITPTTEGPPPDSDNDGLPDTWEKAYTTDLTLLSTGNDHDGDGQSDEAERAAGTDPLDFGSRLAALELRPDESSQLVWGSFKSVPGRNYRVWTSPDLSGWTDRGTVRSTSWPAMATEFEMDMNEPPPGKLFLKIATTPAP